MDGLEFQKQAKMQQKREKLQKYRKIKEKIYDILAENITEQEAWFSALCEAGGMIKVKIERLERDIKQEERKNGNERKK